MIETQSNHIMSEGGPLICLERSSKASWGGIDRLTVRCAGARNDYDRACQCDPNHTTIIPLRDGAALILGGEGPLSTSVWRARTGALIIVQTFYSEPNADEKFYLKELDDIIFLNAVRSVEIDVKSGDMILFDSAESGEWMQGASILFSIEPGRYRILTRTYGPDPKTSFLLHRFLRLS